MFAITFQDYYVQQVILTLSTISNINLDSICVYTFTLRQKKNTASSDFIFSRDVLHRLNVRNMQRSQNLQNRSVCLRKIKTRYTHSVIHSQLDDIFAGTLFQHYRRLKFICVDFCEASLEFQKICSNKNNTFYK